MAKDKVTVTLDPGAVTRADDDAAALGLNRSEFVERALTDAHYRLRLARAGNDPLPGGDAAGLRNLLTWQANPEAA